MGESPGWFNGEKSGTKGIGDGKSQKRHIKGASVRKEPAVERASSRKSKGHMEPIRILETAYSIVNVYMLKLGQIDGGGSICQGWINLMKSRG